MLKGNKSVTISYQSVIGDQVAVYMSAQIPESGRSNSSKTIQDLELYEANKEECRKDMQEFEDMLFALEDQQLNLPVTIPEKEAKGGKTR